jgi:hypothetical protein
MDFPEYISSLSDDPVDALNSICTEFFAFYGKNVEYCSKAKMSLGVYKAHDYQIFFSIAEKFIQHFDIDFEHASEIKSHDGVVNFFNQLKLKVSKLYAIQTFDKKFIHSKDNITLSISEKKQIQSQINELRDSLEQASFIEEKHKRRLLIRLEKFQTEAHKAISSLDVFKAGWSEFNDLLEDTGNKAKPIVDRARELFSITKNKDPALIGKDEQPKQIEDKSDEIDVE